MSTFLSLYLIDSKFCSALPLQLVDKHYMCVLKLHGWANSLKSFNFTVNSSTSGGASIFRCNFCYVKHSFKRCHLFQLFSWQGYHGIMEELFCFSLYSVLSHHNSGFFRQFFIPDHLQYVGNGYFKVLWVSCTFLILSAIFLFFVLGFSV